MDKVFKKMFDEAIRCLDWDVIMNFYVTSDDTTFTKRKRGAAVTKEYVRKELKNLVEFVINNQISRFEADQWIIIVDRNQSDLGTALEIIFAPTKSVAFEEEPDYCTEDEIVNEEYEVKVLQELLDKSVKDENYELSAVLRDRINRIKRTMKKPVKVTK